MFSWEKQFLNLFKNTLASALKSYIIWSYEKKIKIKNRLPVEFQNSIQIHRTADQAVGYYCVKYHSIYSIFLTKLFLERYLKSNYFKRQIFHHHFHLTEVNIQGSFGPAYLLQVSKVMMKTFASWNKLALITWISLRNGMRVCGCWAKTHRRIWSGHLFWFVRGLDKMSQVWCKTTIWIRWSSWLLLGNWKKKIDYWQMFLYSHIKIHQIQLPYARHL